MAKRRCAAIETDSDNDDFTCLTLDTPMFKSQFAKRLHHETRQIESEQETPTIGQICTPPNKQCEVQQHREPQRMESERQQMETDNHQPQHQPAINVNLTPVQPPIRSTKVPTLFLPLVPAIVPLINKLTINPNVGKFTTKSMANSGLRVQCDDMATYNVIQNALAEDKTQLHTHQPRSDRGYRVIVRHLHHTTPSSWITEELERLGIQPSNAMASVWKS
ncbi:uncharacterized protein LOC117189639 [Drosophila miranda]|uniref:uncharacterized protein LOC117189639 n=1 Tax=Drosophila miranda TaxID=7229 RepID=UPI00143F26AC|nr:uncharacterized protein LOC117189639 [Drosophila miranda]